MAMAATTVTSAIKILFLLFLQQIFADTFEEIVFVDGTNARARNFEFFGHENVSTAIQRQKSDCVIILMAK
jgi:hypothetical protein